MKLTCTIYILGLLTVIIVFWKTQESCDTFGLNTRQNSQGNYTGFVFLKRTLDYEVKRGYTMTLKAVVSTSRSFFHLRYTLFPYSMCSPYKVLVLYFCLFPPSYWFIQFIYLSVNWLDTKISIFFRDQALYN